LSDDTDPRLDGILDVLISYATQDFSSRIRVSPKLDEIDAIATGINLLAEELDGAVASRRELEAALANLRATQDQLVVAEKFAAIGEIANGVAHELNNPATWVLLGVEQAQRRLAEAKASVGDGDLALELGAIEATLADVSIGLERMRAVIGDLRTLSRVDAEQRVAVDLDDTVRAACQLARPAYHSVARLVLELGGTPPVVGDRGRLGQVVTNLVINAAHALADRSGDNEIAITTSTAGTDVVLAVEDNGPGIPDELCERVFDPYFTTKPAEVGTGLGLALVRRIVELHGGRVRAMRGSRGGARIEVRLPMQRELPPARFERARTPLPAGARTRTRVLIIDDEPLLLRALDEALRDEADVVTALGGDAAIELLGSDPAFDLVICDLQMPRLDAVAFHAQLSELAPELIDRLVVMTGGAVTARATRFMQTVRPRVLSKPIDVDDLLRLTREVASW
jgi:signal transduction histidine kinase